MGIGRFFAQRVNRDGLQPLGYGRQRTIPWVGPRKLRACLLSGALLALIFAAIESALARRVPERIKIGRSVRQLNQIAAEIEHNALMLPAPDFQAILREIERKKGKEFMCSELNGRLAIVFNTNLALWRQPSNAFSSIAIASPYRLWDATNRSYFYVGVTFGSETIALRERPSALFGSNK